MKERTLRKKTMFLLSGFAYVLIMGASLSALWSQNDNTKTILNNEYRAIALVQPCKYEFFVDPDIPKEPENIVTSDEKVEPEIIAQVQGKDAEKLFHPFIMRVADEYDIDPALIKSIIWAESSFNPRAVSHKGAVGLMQLMPSTAESLGVKDTLNPESNIDGGVRYFKQLLVKFKGDSKLALAAYNAGSRRVMEYNGVPPFKATQYYVKKVLEYYKEYKRFESIEINQI